MYRCGRCHTAFVSPTPSPAFLEAFYDSYHRPLSEGGEYASFEERAAQDFDAKSKHMRSVLGAGRWRTLDVGCGKGHFLKACEPNGWDSQGIDLSSSAVESARKLGLVAHVGRLEEHAAHLGLFDAVSFWATIEHLPDPFSMLRAMRAVLKPGGYVFLDTGIGWDWLDRGLPGRTQWYDPPQHLFVFSRNGIVRLMERAGFEIVAIDPCFERNGLRRAARLARAAVAVAALRVAYLVSGLSVEPGGATRFPIGNLMMVVGRAMPRAQV